MTTTPEETAAILVQENFTVEKYQHLQDLRKARLKKWEGTGVQALINAEKELIAFGEEVIKLMQEAYAAKNNLN